MITLYDFPTNLPGKSFSPYVWRARLALNIKGVEHKTHWIPLHDIGGHLEAQGFPPSEVTPSNPNAPRYTVPSISDDATSRKVVDSSKIFEYLDEAYPSAPMLSASQLLDASPHSAQLRELGVESAFSPQWDLPRNMLQPLWRWFAPTVIEHGFEDGKDTARFRGNFERYLASVGTPSLEEYLRDDEKRMAPVSEAKDAFTTADGWLQRAKEVHGGQWALGESITSVDIALVVPLAWAVATFGEDSEEWHIISREWDGGRWGQLWERMKEFSVVV